MPVQPAVAATPALGAAPDAAPVQAAAQKTDAAPVETAETMAAAAAPAVETASPTADAPTQAQRDTAKAAVNAGSIADKLQRIRAVVNKAKSAPIIASDYEDDEAGDFVAQTAASLEDALEEDADLDAAVAAEPGAEEPALDDVAAQAPEDLDAVAQEDAVAADDSDDTWTADEDAGVYEEDDHGFVEAAMIPQPPETPETPEITGNAAKAAASDVEKPVADARADGYADGDEEAEDGEEVDNLWTSETTSDPDAARVAETREDATPSLSELAAELSGPMHDAHDDGADKDDAVTLVAEDADTAEALAHAADAEPAEVAFADMAADDPVAEADTASADTHAADDVLLGAGIDHAEVEEETADEIGSEIDVSDMMSRIDATEVEEEDAVAEAPNPEEALKAAMRDALGADEGVGEDNDEDIGATADDIAEDAAQDDAIAASAARTRILKVEKSALDEAIASGLVEDDTPPASSLSAEDEAELEAELAQVQADADADAQAESDPLILSQDDVVSADAQAEVYEDEEAPELEETDVDRLMDKADAQMDEPETAKRRNAFQALKAAVAARKADKALSKDTGVDDEDAYRSDLAEVVQPGPAEAEEASARRARVKTRAAPLRLVAEQRVDETPAPTPAPTPVAVPAAAEGPAAGMQDDTETEFEKYAAELGAHALPDLLEAAASYLAFVEGKEQFSRPQLITKVRQVQQANFSREDGLRSFGQLLRAGKIEKVRGGRFTVTSDIGYRPDKRVAG